MCVTTLFWSLSFRIIETIDIIYWQIDQNIYAEMSVKWKGLSDSVQLPVYYLYIE